MQLDDGLNLQEEVTTIRNVATSYVINSAGVYGYTGGNPLEYPWQDGYGFIKSANGLSLVLFDLKSDPYHGL
jgi:hypothetical protein